MSSYSPAAVQVTVTARDASLRDARSSHGWSAPRPCGPIASRSRRRTGALTYAELLERAPRRRARGLGGVACRASTLPPGLDVRRRRCTPACWPAPVADARSSRAARPRRRARDARASPARDAPGRGATRRSIVHTSGTTGAPQPVELTLRQRARATRSGSAVALGLDPAERWLCPLPLSHVGGLMVLLRSRSTRTTAVHRPGRRAPRTSRSPRWCRRARAPARRGRRSRPRLRACCSAAAPADRALLARAPRRRLAGRADLRPHRGVLAGHVGEVGDAETSGRAAAGRRPWRSRRRRDPRRRPDGGRRRHACAPATSAASTTAAG